MSISGFDEWFAIRSDHSHDEHWNARLLFDPSDGIRVITARFMSKGGKSINSTMINGTMTGWLDYQRPATLINPWIQAVGGFSMGLNTPAMREKYTIVAESILKNVFLTDLAEQIFTGIDVEHPAIHAWIQPNLINHEWVFADENTSPAISVEVKPSRERSFELTDGTKLTFVSAVRAPNSQLGHTEDYTTLQLRLPKPVAYHEILKIIWRISSLFEFMIGERVSEPTFQLFTTHRRRWNDEDREVIAELCYQSAHKRSATKQIDNFYVLTSEEKSPVTIEQLSSFLLDGNDELLYLANIIQSADDHELPSVQIFGELLGCLEDFDARQFGSGADPNFRSDIRNLSKLVQQHGTSDDKFFFERIQGGAKNSYSLLKRLERLHSMWRGDDFRGNPDLRRIRDLRNLIPHGQGLQINNEAAQEIIYFLSYLKALGRYHVFRKIGFSGLDIARSFLRKPNKFAMFVPKRIVQPDELQESGKPDSADCNG